MPVEEQAPEIFGAVDDALAQHRVFGDSTYIFEQLERWLLRRLENVAPRLPAAGELRATVDAARSGSLEHVLGETVVRCAIIHAHQQVALGLDPDERLGPHLLPLADCEVILAGAARRLREGQLGPSVDDGSLRRIGSAPYHGWLWTDEHPNDVFGRAFRALVSARYDALPDVPSDDETAVLRQGAQLLEELLPSSGPSLVMHT
jgi:hypothetical protein